MPSSDLAYYERRVVSERTMAATADSPEAAAIHAELAQQYEVVVELAKMGDLPTKPDRTETEKSKPHWHPDWQSSGRHLSSSTIPDTLGR